MNIRVDREYRAQAHADAENTLAKFQIETLVNQEIDGRWYRRFFCSENRSSNYCFDVFEYGNLLVVTGDVGDWIWQRERRMLDWVLGAWKSDEYWHEKLVASGRHGDVSQFHKPWAAEWIAEQRKDINDDDYHDAKHKAACLEELSEIEDEWKRADIEHEYEFYRILWESKYFHDSESFPALQRFSYRFHWMQRAIGWLAEQVKT